jgi:hypothetical protein
LINAFTKETYEYTLEGKVDDPLAEGNIVINCKTKTVVKEKITIENTSDRDIVYTVETDLGDIIRGDKMITVPSGKTINYEISIMPLLGKTYFGQITFTDDRKNYRWWTVKVVAESSYTNTRDTEMKTTIRKAIYVEINLDNPLNEYVTFNVNIEGEFLWGEPEIRLEPKKSATYILYYTPLKIGTWEGRVHIYNERIDEFLYKLKLTCEENSPIYPELLKAELGKHTDLKIYLENPINEDVEVFYTQPMRLFKIYPEKITLPPYTTKEVTVRYNPSTLDIEEECQLVFDTHKVGKWIYHIKGKGFPPTPMEKTIVNTYVGGITSGSITFKNPFNEKINVWVELKCEEWQGTFRLLSKKDKYPLDPFKPLNIAFTFSPQKLTKYSADIYIHASKSLFWRFPIEGITEVKSKGVDYTFKTKAKKTLEEKILLDLSNLPEGETDETFTFQQKIKEEKYRSLVEKCFSVAEDKTKSSLDVPKNKLPMLVRFTPLRPFKTDLEFIVSKQSGGQWIYNFILEATEPEPDDIITIQSSLHNVANVSFKLQNYFTKNAKFVAYFSHDSTSEFSVKPREGILDQSGKEGTLFIISYLPVEYGKVKIGKLIIETDEIQW